MEMKICQQKAIELHTSNAIILVYQARFEEGIN